MTRRWFWSALAAIALIAPSFLMGLGETEFFKIEDLRPGMKGTGKTCYQGTEPAEFQVEILGVLHGVGPGTDAVLAKLSGGLLDKTGVFEGMSGSPVFIDGKLLGAVAFSYSFAKEAIGGITPITQMVKAFEESGDSQGPNVILKKSALWNYRLPENQGNGLTLLTSEMRQHPVTSFGSHALVPIATPLSFGGLDPQTVKLFAPEFQSLGMSMLQGVGGSGVAANAKKEGEDTQLEPGSNIVVSLVRGDLDVSAGGTVTYVDGKKLYAFGHNMFDLGFTELPMHKAKAITVFPSLQNSFKILQTGEMVGSIRQDRGSGVFGIIGEKPRMVPMQVHLTTSRGNKSDLKYELARDPFLTPLLVNLTLYNSIIASERALGTVTLKVQGKINIKNEEPVELDSRFSSDASAPALASLSIALPVNYLFSAGYKNLDLEGIDIQISSQESDQSALLDSIRFGRTEVKAGESLDLEVSYKKSDGEMFEDKYPVKIPANASPGTLTMLVADGTTLMQLDDQEEGENLIPRDLSQLIKFINNLRKNDHLYLRFFRQEPGALVRGEGLPGLPPSILSIFKSERKVGAISAIRISTMMEYELPATDYMITGAKVLRLTVKP